MPCMPQLARGPLCIQNQVLQGVDLSGTSRVLIARIQICFAKGRSLSEDFEYINVLWLADVQNTKNY